METLLWLAGVVVGLYGLHRVACWMEGQGWIYWTKSRGYGTRAGAAMLEVQSVLEPGKKQMVEVKREKKVVRDEEGGGAGGAPPRG